MQSNKNSALSNDLPQFDWWHIFKTSRQALQPAKLLLAAAGLLLTFLLGTALDKTWTAFKWGIDTDGLKSSPMMVELSGEADGAVHGVFAVLLEHEKHCLDQALKAARKLELTVGMGDIWSRLDRPGSTAGGSRAILTVGEGYGVIAFVLAMGKGLHWVVTHHWMYSTILGALALTIWSLFGGAICRISALQFALDQRMTMGEALRYSREKFGAFFVAPLAPVFIILLIGLCMMIGGWLMRFIPYVGPALGGLVFGLALIGGGIMALFLIGTLFGFSLMWPTVAVEGLDFTDAISRSLSYVYERMERTVLYALLAIFYGALVWLVVRFFAFALAYGTHFFVGTAYPQLDQMWVTPSYDQLYAIPEAAAEIEDWGTRIAFPLIRTWVSIGGFLLYGYLISFYFTGSTIIYFLLRRQVDDTELDDVYIESPPDSQAAPPPPESSSDKT